MSPHHPVQPASEPSPKGKRCSKDYKVVSQNQGYLFRGPTDEDYSILGSILGVPLFWETSINRAWNKPCLDVQHLGVQVKRLEFKVFGV